MSLPPKAPPVYRPAQPQMAAPLVYRPQQVKAGVQLKPAAHFRLETRPAPPVYRPASAVSQPFRSDRNLQLGAGRNFRMEFHPPLPDCQPQSVKPVLQPKLLHGLSTAQRGIGITNNSLKQIPIAYSKPPQSAINSQSLNRLPNRVSAKAYAVQAKKMLIPAAPRHQNSAIVQRCGLLDYFSSCWKPKRNDDDEDSNEVILNEDLEDIKVESKGRMIRLMQGWDDIAQVGDTVSNVGITGCGLALGFGSKGVVAYHWPGMAKNYLSKFMGLASAVGTLTKIEIYTSPVPINGESGYRETAEAIYEAYQIKTTHYTYGDDVRGEDVQVKITNDGAELIWPKNRKIFWSSS